MKRQTIRLLLLAGLGAACPFVIPCPAVEAPAGSDVLLFGDRASYTWAIGELGPTTMIDFEGLAASPSGCSRDGDA